MGSRWTRPSAMASTTASADSGDANRYSPACSPRSRPLRHSARRNVVSSLTTPAAASRRPISGVGVPGGMSTKTSPPS